MLGVFVGWNILLNNGLHQPNVFHFSYPGELLLIVQYPAQVPYPLTPLGTYPSFSVPPKPPMSRVSLHCISYYACLSSSLDPELFEDGLVFISLSVCLPYLAQHLVHMSVGGMEMKGKAMMFFGTVSSTSLRYGSMIIGTDFSSSSQLKSLAPL